MTTATLEPPRVFRYEPPRRLSSLSIVMPAYNEAENIVATVRDALAAAASVTDRFEVVVVDDGSTDDTVAIVESLVAVHGGAVRLIRNERNLGYGPTVRRALAAADMEWVLFTDSDRQFDFAELSLLVPLTDDADIVTGWRRHRQDPWSRRRNARIFNLAGRLVFGTGVRDVDCAFKLMRTSALRRLELTADSAMINTELFYQARRNGLRVRQLAVTHLERKFGQPTGGDPKVIGRAVREFVAMRQRFNSQMSSRLRLHTRLVGLLAFLAGAAGTWWALAHHAVLAYGDAEAHLNIAKRVVGGLTGGFAQLGSVWLPLPHVAMLPFVISDAMWRSGIAGPAVSVPALVLLAVMAYKLAHLLTGQVRVSWLAPLVILANPNTLYLSATPMTEVLLLALVTASLYYLASWVLHDGLRSLVLAGLCGGLASLARYDGWALVCMEALVVLVVAVVRHRRGGAVDGLVILFGVLAFAGIAGWLVWNELIFSDPLYFASSVYGSAEQQRFFLANGLLPTYHNAGRSVIYWLEDVRIVAGSTLMVVAAAGLVLLTARAVRQRRMGPALIAFVALSSFAFYVLSLWLGQASLILPRFAPAGAPYTMSNIRYGLQALLPIALFVAYLAARKPKVLGPVLVLVILAQGVLSVVTHRVMTYEDGTRGLSSQAVSKGPDAPPVEAWLRRNYDGGLVLMDDYRRPIGPVESGVPMHDFIGVGNKPYWQESLDNPGRYATWVILQQGDTDAVWKGFGPLARSILDDHFAEVYRSGAIFVYKRRPPASDFVQKQGQHLYLGGKRWRAAGVNSYDLLTQPQAAIDSRIDALSNAGHNTVRTWCFDKDGGISDGSLRKLAETVQFAYKRDVRLVCTLANYYADFGGQPHFTAPGEDFFGSATARIRYEAQVRRILEYAGSDGTRLADSPGILAWDLINEPRVNAGQPADSVRNWTDQMSSFVASIDQRHLVTVGAEGFRSGYPAVASMAGPPGSGFADLCAIPSITLCSVHLFPKYLSNPAAPANPANVVQGWRSDADSLGKPVFVGELGYSLADGGDAAARAAFYAAAGRAIANSDLDGALLWNLGRKADRSFTLAWNDPASLAELNRWPDLITRQ
jgi:hypothetical protein